MSLITASVDKNSRILAGIYFIFFKNRPRPNLNTKFGPHRKDTKSSYQVRQDLPHFCSKFKLKLCQRP